EAEGPVSTQVWAKCLDDLLAIIKTVESSIFDGHEHIGKGSIVNLVRRFRHTELPGGVHPVTLEWEQHIGLLRFEFKNSGRISRGSQSYQLWIAANGYGLEDLRANHGTGHTGASERSVNTLGWGNQRDHGCSHTPDQAEVVAGKVAIEACHRRGEAHDPCLAEL